MVSWPIGFAGGFNGSLTGEENCRFVARIYSQSVDRVVDATREFAGLGCGGPCISLLCGVARARRSLTASSLVMDLMFLMRQFLLQLTSWRCLLQRQVS